MTKAVKCQIFGSGVVYGSVKNRTHCLFFHCLFFFKSLHYMLIAAITVIWDKNRRNTMATNAPGSLDLLVAVPEFNIDCNYICPEKLLCHEVSPKTTSL